MTDYLDSVDDVRRPVLAHVIDIARGIVPDAEEGMSYGMPALRHRGKPLIAVVAAARHLSVFPFSGHVVEVVASALEGYSLSKGTIRFAVDRPLLDAVIEEMVRLRVAEIESGAWRHPRFRVSARLP